MNQVIKSLYTAAALFLSVSANAATFLCEGITVTYNSNTYKQAEDGSFYSDDTESLIVSGISAGNLKTYGEITFSDIDNIQKVGVINGRFVNFSYYPATKEATLTSDAVVYQCKRA